MNISVDSRIRAMDLSNDAVADHVLEIWNRLDSNGKRPKKRSVGVKVGELRRGQDRWWRRADRRFALDALAEVLHCNVEDLIEQHVHPQPTVGFAALGPLEQGHDPAPLLSGTWLGRVVEAQIIEGGRTWVTVPPGWGKSLAMEWLALNRGRSLRLETTDCLGAVVLPDAGTDHRPLVVHVRFPGARTDATSLHALTRRRSPLVILAAFDPPASVGWAHTSLARQPGDLSWRGQLMRWCQLRLPEESRFDVLDLEDWLREVDADGDLVTSPGGLMPIIAWCHRHGAPKAKTSLASIADAHVEERTAGVGRSAQGRLPLSGFLGRLATAAMDAACGGRQPHTREDWEQLAASVADVGQRMLASSSVAALVDAGILRSERHGLDLGPSWLKAAYEREGVLNAFKEGDHAKWGRWAANPELRQVVVTCLLTLPPLSVLRSWDSSTCSVQDGLARGGIVETCFEVLARRILGHDGLAEDGRSWTPKEEQLEALARLGREQAQLLALRPPSRAALPQSLLGHGASHPAEHARWLAAAWNFSLVVPCPDNLPSGIGGVLPAWQSPDKSVLQQLPFVGGTSTAAEHAGVAAFCRVAVRVAERVPDILEAPAHFALVPAILIGGTRELTGAEYRGFWGSRGPDLVPILTEHLDETQQADICARIWAPAVVIRGGNPAAAFQEAREQHPLFARQLARMLRSTDFVCKVEPQELMRRLQPSQLQALPRAFVAELLRVLAPAIAEADRPAYFSGLEVGVEALDDFETVLLMMRDLGEVGRAAAARAWMLDEERSRAHVRALLHGDGAGLLNCLASCPSSSLETITEAVMSSPYSRAPWLADWLMQRINQNDPRSSELFALLLRATSH